MKSLKTPHLFAAQSAVAAEDVNKNFHHFLREKENSNRKRYGYSSLRIPFSCFSENQVVGLNPNTDAVSRPGGATSATRPGARPLWNPRRLHKRNHEAIRTFSFVPPEDIRVVGAELFCKADFVLEETSGVPISSSAKTDVTVNFLVEDGGEGYPPRPASVLPIGFQSDLDPALNKLHPILSMSFESDDLGDFKIISSNAEYLLKKNKCYRIRISSPADNTYYKSCYFDLRFQYDRFRGIDPSIPDIDFVNANDNVSKAPIVSNLQTIVDDAEQELSELRTMKPELYYFGLGEMNGRFKRANKHNTGGVAYQSTMQSFVDITGGPGQTTADVWDSNELFNFISDFEQFYFNSGSYDWDLPEYKTMLTDIAFEFFDSFTSRSPMAPKINFFDEASSVPEDKRGNLGDYAGLRDKVILGYSIGILHNSSYHHCMFSESERGFHFGMNFQGKIGHGLSGETTMKDKPHFWAAPSTPEASSSAGREVAVQGDDYNPLNPNPERRNYIALHLSNDYPASNQQLGFEINPDIDQRWNANTSPFASTQVPNTNYQADILNAVGVTANEATALTGYASGIPGTYLAELHRATPYGIDAYGTMMGSTANYKGSMSTSVENFRTLSQTDRANFGSSLYTNDVMIDLFLTVVTYLSNSGRDKTTAARDPALLYRHLQKMYMLVWVA